MNHKLIMLPGHPTDKGSFDFLGSLGSTNTERFKFIDIFEGDTPGRKQIAIGECPKRLAHFETNANPNV